MRRYFLSLGFMLALVYSLGQILAADLPPGHPEIMKQDETVSPGLGGESSMITEADRQWWAFQPLAKAVPPSVKHSSWVRTPVDQFILARLEKEGLRPNPPAPPRVLLRRASFDLLGLPPTAGQVKALAEDHHPEAWLQSVRTLLDHPAYGERWARHWLDVARFAESHGFEHDYDRPHAYHYRDFVIRALNSDMPYDQFVRWQLAGDEYEPDNPQALMATGFLGAGVFPTQITANEVERTRYDALDDMLSTTGTAMLGLTIGCARCHDHKFDPIPAHDYYRLLSTFTTTVRSDIELDLNPEEFRRAKSEFDNRHAGITASLERYEQEELPSRFQAWLSDKSHLPIQPAWEVLAFDTMKSKEGATFRELEDGSYLVEGNNAEFDSYTLETRLDRSGLRALRLEALAHPSMVKGGPGRASNGNMGLSRIRLWAETLPDGPMREIELVRPQATFEQNNSNLSIAATLDDKPNSGWAVDPQFGKDHAVVYGLGSPLEFEGEVRLKVQLDFEVNGRHNIGRPRLSVSTALNPGLGEPALPKAVTSLLAMMEKDPDYQLTDEERTVLLDWWKATEPGWMALHAAVQDHLASMPEPALTKVMVCAEGYKPMRHHSQGKDFFDQTFFLERGDIHKKKGEATPSFLQVLMRPSETGERWRWQPPDGARYSGRRRSLATWITDLDHGAGALAARVMVNRLWQHHFGTGLVSTPNDFGVQGARPSHPELLDWLAAELVRQDWRLKPMHELIMNSAVYRQSARLHPEAVQADPENRWWARREPRRLEGETIRDAMLLVSGALDDRMFGPGTLDESSRRRSIYFTIKRSRIIPMMQTFDQPEPLVSQANRPVTTVAPQALLIMNNAQVRSWAQQFGQRLLEEVGSEPIPMVRRAYELALGREPTPFEEEMAVTFLQQQKQRYAVSKKPQTETLARTDFAQVMLGLNEFVYVE